MPVRSCDQQNTARWTQDTRLQRRSLSLSLNIRFRSNVKPDREEPPLPRATRTDDPYGQAEQLAEQQETDDQEQAKAAEVAAQTRLAEESGYMAAGGLVKKKNKRRNGKGLAKRK